MVDDLNRKFTPTGNISDELLSAYLDGEVTPEERVLVERTVAGSSEVAWRLDALRQTVALMGQLPRVPLPRSFTLSEADVRPVRRAGRDTARWWQTLLNPVFLRNATAVATMLFLVVLVGNVMLSSLAPAAPASPSATVVVQAPVERVAKEAAPTTANAASAAEPAALSAAAPAPTEATAPAEMPLPTESMAIVPAPEPTRGPAPLAEVEAPPAAVTAQAAEDTAASAALAAGSAGEATALPTSAATSAVEVARQAEATAVSETALTTLAETAPAVEITGAAPEVPEQGAAPARASAAAGRSWLDVAAMVLGGLALLFFGAWQLRLRAVRGSR